MATDEKTKKLTEGNPMRLIIGFAIPMLSGLLFQQMYSLVDTIIVGKCLGVNALAAVGTTGAINFFVNGFCIGVCSGFAIPVAQRFGASEYSSMRKYVTNAIWLSVIIAAVLTTVVSVFCRQILLAMNTPENIIDQAYSYIFIIFLGIPVTFLYNLTAGVMRSLGDSRTPVYFLLLASVINIALDFVFILWLGFGVNGPALATVISQTIAGLGCLVYMIRKFPILKTEKGEWKLGKHHVAVLMGVGVPMGLQYSITAIGSLILQTSVNGLGSSAVASMTAGTKVNMFLVCPFDALGGTMATWAGQNVGAKKIDRVREGLRDAMILGAIYSVIDIAIVIFAGKYLMLLFLDASEVMVIANALKLLRLNAYFAVTLAAVNIYRFAIQGLGFSSLAICSGIMEMIARAGVAIILVPIFGFNGAIWASALAWVMADAFLVPTFHILCRKMEKKFQEGSAL